MPPDESENLESLLDDRFKADIRALAEHVPVPPEVDAAVLAVARTHLRATRRPAVLARIGRWAAGVAAAAAVTIAVLLAWPDGAPQTDERAMVAESADDVTPTDVVMPGDIDGNHTINIIDAYRLAKLIERGIATNAMHDINADGVVDQRDVDAIAQHAVTLPGAAS